MLAVYVILTIVVSCVTVVATYFLLNAEGECAQVEVVVVATVLPPCVIYVYFMLQDYVSQVLSIHMLSFILFRLTHSLCSSLSPCATSTWVPCRPPVGVARFRIGRIRRALRLPLLRVLLFVPDRVSSVESLGSKLKTHPLLR